MDSETSALEEFFAAMGTHVGKTRLVPFEVIVHGALVTLRSGTGRTDTFALSILDIFIRHAAIPTWSLWVAWC